MSDEVETIVCPNCKARRSPRFRVCPRCGEPLPPPSFVATPVAPRPSTPLRSTARPISRPPLPPITGTIQPPKMETPATVVPILRPTTVVEPPPTGLPPPGLGLLLRRWWPAVVVIAAVAILVVVLVSFGAFDGPKTITVTVGPDRWVSVDPRRSFGAGRDFRLLAEGPLRIRTSSGKPLLSNGTPMSLGGIGSDTIELKSASRAQTVTLVAR